jgi:hypothetical protein
MSFGEVASYCAAVGGQEMVDRLLREVFQLRADPTRMHRYLAGLALHAPLMVLTTTWDTLTERAFDEVGAPYEILFNVYSPTDGIGLRRSQNGGSLPEVANPISFKPHRDTPCIYKLFGSALAERNAADTLIATEESQIALFAEIMAGRIPPPAVREQIETHHILFLGVGLRGWTERQLFSLLRSPRYRRDTNAWAVVRGVCALEKSRWESLGVSVYDEDIREFASHLSDLP